MMAARLPIDDLLNIVQPPVPAAKSPPLQTPGEWKLTGLVLRVTYRTCLCGETHKNVDLYDHYIKPEKLLGKTVLSRRLVPSNLTYPPRDIDIQQTFETKSIACCPTCVERVVGSPRPPISEMAWAETLRRKAADDEALRIAAKKPTKPMPPSLSEITNLIWGPK